MTPPRQFYPGLEALRACAAVGVLTTHVAFAQGFSGDSPLERLIGRLDLMVAVFFVLSGFVLWPKRQPAGAFLWRRFWRLYPAYAVTVLAVLSLLPVAAEAGWREWLLSLSLTQIYAPQALVGGLTHLWSLAVEWAFSLTLPVLWALTRGRSWWVRSGICALCGLAGATLAALPADPATQFNPHLLPPVTGLWCLAGCILAELLPHCAPRGISRPVALSAGGVAVLGWIAASGPWAGPAGFVHPSTGEFLFRLACGVVVGVGAVVAALGLRTVPAWLGHIGRWSYSLFLWHVAVLSVVQQALLLTPFSRHLGETLLLWFVTLGVSLCVAAASFHLLEQRWLTPPPVPGRSRRG